MHIQCTVFDFRPQLLSTYRSKEFFKDNKGRIFFVNVERRLALMSNFIPKVEELNFADMWFQQDGVKCHKAGEAMTQFRCEFGDKFVSLWGRQISVDIS